MSPRTASSAQRRTVSRRRLAVALGSAAASASWMTLVAATALGVPELQRVRARVSVDRPALPGKSDEYRLVVHSYSADSLVDGVPALHARPLASTQRSVTAEELSDGVAVEVVGVGSSTGQAPMIVAWVEQGAPDLEFDGRRARPSRDAYIGVASTVNSSEHARVVLSKRSA